MAYYLVRLYSGSGDRPAEQLIREVVANELAPKLQQAGGLQRYIAGVTDDGRLVSASIYDTKHSADRGMEVARQWASATGAMRGYQLQQSFGGQVIREIDGKARGVHPTHGVGRLYRTAATAEQVAEAFTEVLSGGQMGDAEGRVRTLFLQLDDGRVAAVSAFTSEKERDRMTSLVREHRSSNERMKSLLPEQPEQINTQILVVTGA